MFFAVVGTVERPASESCRTGSVRVRALTLGAPKRGALRPSFAKPHPPGSGTRIGESRSGPPLFATSRGRFAISPTTASLLSATWKSSRARLVWLAEPPSAHSSCQSAHSDSLSTSHQHGTTVCKRFEKLTSLAVIWSLPWARSALAQSAPMGWSASCHSPSALSLLATSDPPTPPAPKIQRRRCTNGQVKKRSGAAALLDHPSDRMGAVHAKISRRRAPKTANPTAPSTSRAPEVS